MSLPLHSAAEVYALESTLARDHGLTGMMLMARAGEVLLRCLRSNWPQARRVLIVVGSGNNGGDGYVLARLLRERTQVEVDLLALAPARAEVAADAARQWRQAGGQIQGWQSEQRLPDADLIVDGLFGVGLARPIEGAVAILVDAINAHPAPVFSIDVPSGLDADCGYAAAAIIQAERSLCLLARKRGLYTGRAVDVTGALDFDALGVDPALMAGDTAVALMARNDLVEVLPKRRRGAHKGDHGHVLVVGGDAGTSGAARIAATAALRAGAGWVSVATRAGHASTLAPDRPELMVHGVEDAPALTPATARADVLAVGPGLGQGDWSRVILDAALAAGRPLVLDADALNLLAAASRPLPAGSILTPHPGEAARLLGCTVAEVERDRYSAVRELARRHGAIVVLKGAGSLVDDGRSCRVCPFGNPGMASAGMGDALTGIIAAFVGQGLAPFDAACAGVLAHALAGDAAAHAGGERGLLAGDLIESLRAIINQ